LSFAHNLLAIITIILGLLIYSASLVVVPYIIYKTVQIKNRLGALIYRNAPIELLVISAALVLVSFYFLTQRAKLFIFFLGSPFSGLTADQEFMLQLDYFIDVANSFAVFALMLFILFGVFKNGEIRENGIFSMFTLFTWEELCCFYVTDKDTIEIVTSKKALFSSQNLKIQWKFFKHEDEGKREKVRDILRNYIEENDYQVHPSCNNHFEGKR